MKRGCFWAFLVVAVLLVKTASANFACGEVGGIGNFTSSWFDVQVYYSQNATEKTSCKVSPDGGKYCCDPLQIKSVSWQIGKVLNAKVVQNGYFAGPVNLTISGEGFDVFPKMNLIRWLNLSNRSIFLNVSEVEFDSYSSFNLTNLSYIVINSQNNQTIKSGVVCQNCSGEKINVSGLGFGDYELKLFGVTKEGSVLTESKKFWLLQFIDLQREINCRRCSRNYVYSGEEVEVKVKARFSHAVSGELKDYFPNDWSFAGVEAVEQFSESHDSVSWKINGNYAEKVYKLKAPGTIFANKYYFQSAFEDFSDSKDEFVLYSFYKFLPFPKKFLVDSPRRNYYAEFEQTSPEMPLVLNLNENYILQIAIFPNSALTDKYAFVNLNSPVKLKNGNVNFLIGSDVGKNYFDRLMIRYKLEKNQGVKNLTNYSLWSYDEQTLSWLKIESAKYDEDEKYYYFEAYSQKEGIFSIKTEYARLK